MQTTDADFDALLKAWDGQGVFIRYDSASGSWIFIAMHDFTRGPAVGGCRMKVYPSPAEGLKDALRLAEGMTYKWAAVDIPFGGGKSVIAIPAPVQGEERAALLARFGYLLESLRGCFATGVDMGTTPADMHTLAQSTRYVMGQAKGTNVSLDPGPYTALGVLTGLSTAVQHVFGSDVLTDRSVLVQGVGDVGRPLVKALLDADACVLISDVATDRVERLAAELDVEIVPPASVYDTECDVYAPCAVGATLNADTIPRLRCRIVAGSANNQLESSQDAERLHTRGIVYVPDYIINAGGAIAFGLLHLGEEDPREWDTRVRKIGSAVDEILNEAKAHGESPERAARRRAERILKQV